MADIIKEFYGFSGNKVYLIKDNAKLFVRKIGKVSRNIERLTALSGKCPLPAIYEYSDSHLDLEYIHGLDIKNYLLTHNSENFINFFTSFFEFLSKDTVEKDYTQVYIDKLNQVDFRDKLCFNKDQLLEKLPKVLPASEYYGDLTLENIIYSEQEGFVLIDCQTIEYDSYIFDIAKLRQDLECKWFIRNDKLILDVKLNHIQQALLEQYPLANNDYLLILMLLRIYRYTNPNTFEEEFLVNCINRLWK